MKVLSVFWLFGILAVGLTVAPVGAETYLSGNIGFSSPSDADLKDGDDRGELKFDDGFAVTGALGHTLGSTARVELELGYRDNDIDQVTISGLGAVAGRGEMTTISLMGNAYYDFATAASFTPFVGAGVGVANVKAEVDSIGSETDNVFAYQLVAGGSLGVTPNLSVDLQYRYFATADPDFDGVESEYHTHNLMFGLRLTF